MSPLAERGRGKVSSLGRRVDWGGGAAADPTLVAVRVHGMTKNPRAGGRVGQGRVGRSGEEVRCLGQGHYSVDDLHSSRRMYAARNHRCHLLFVHLFVASYTRYKASVLSVAYTSNG